MSTGGVHRCLHHRRSDCRPPACHREGLAAVVHEDVERHLRARRIGRADDHLEVERVRRRGAFPHLHEDRQGSLPVERDLDPLLGENIRRFPVVEGLLVERGTPSVGGHVAAEHARRLGEVCREELERPHEVGAAGEGEDGRIPAVREGERRKQPTGAGVVPSEEDIRRVAQGRGSVERVRMGFGAEVREQADCLRHGVDARVTCGPGLHDSKGQKAEHRSLGRIGLTIGLPMVSLCVQARLAPPAARRRRVRSLSPRPARAR